MNPPPTSKEAYGCRIIPPAKATTQAAAAVVLATQLRAGTRGSDTTPQKRPNLSG